MGLFDDDDPQKYLSDAMKEYQNAVVPTVASETLQNLPQETVQGTITPDQIVAAQQAPTAYNDIALDPATRAAQMDALKQYTDIAGSGGLDASAKLSIQQAIDAANTQSRGAQGAIMNTAQAMGQGGGDFALTQRALAAQGASNNAATQGMQAAAEAEANREAALNSMANIGGSINAADYGQAANKAASTNAINATNTSATNAANTGNVANKMAAGQFNTTNAQGVNAANTTAGQNQAYYNAALPQQKFNNELAKAGGVAGLSGAQSNAATQANAQSNAMAGKLVGTAGTVLSAAHGAVVPSKGYTCYADGGVAHDHAICMKLGGHVPGEATVPGDSEENDTVDAKLSPGELVIPRSVPKDGASMEAFAKNAPVGGDTKKKVDLTSFTTGYKRGR